MVKRFISRMSGISISDITFKFTEKNRIKRLLLWQKYAGNFLHSQINSVVAPKS